MGKAIGLDNKKFTDMKRPHNNTHKRFIYVSHYVQNTYGILYSTGIYHQKAKKQISNPILQH